MLSRSSQHQVILTNFFLFGTQGLRKLIYRKSDGQSVPIISGVFVDIHTGKISSAEFNRTFTDFVPDIRNVLLIFPPLIKNKSSLKSMIAKQEDRGFAGAKGIRGYDTEVRRY